MPKFVFDDDVDKKEYAYSLLNPAEIKQIESESARWMEPDTIRSILSNNVMKSDEINTLAASIVLHIDTRINYPIFMISNEVYTREDLLEIYPLEDFGKCPEDLTEQQEFGVFPYSVDVYEQSIESKRFDTSLIDDEKNEYVQRRVGSSAPFIKTKDLIHYLCKSAALKRSTKPEESTPFRIVKTKLFIAKQEWGDFIFMHKFARGISMALSIEGGTGHAMKAIAYFINGVIKSLPMICGSQDGQDAACRDQADAGVNDNIDITNLAFSDEDMRLLGNFIDSDNLSAIQE